MTNITDYQRGRRAGENKHRQGVNRVPPIDVKNRDEWLQGFDSVEGVDAVNHPQHGSENSILDRAKAIISGDRQTVNGRPERSFHKIAERWSLTLGLSVTAQQVALMMVDLKMVRALEGVTTEGQDDHFVDMAGYVALAAELGD